MINIQQFKELQKKSSQSYHQQKKLIKKLLAGQTVYCQQCQQKLLFNIEANNHIVHIYCGKNCTDLELSID